MVLKIERIKDDNEFELITNNVGQYKILEYAKYNTPQKKSIMMTQTNRNKLKMK